MALLTLQIITPVAASEATRDEVAEEKTLPLSIIKPYINIIMVFYIGLYH